MKKVHKFTFKHAIILSLSICMVFVSYTVYPEAFRFKPLKISAAIIESIAYNSNVGYGDKGNEFSDWANKLAGKLSIELPFGNIHRYSLDVRSSWLKYFNENDFDQFNNVLTHYVDLIFNKWSVNIHHTLDASSEPRIDEMPYLEKGLLEKFANYPGIAIKGDLGKLKLSGGFDYQNYRTNKKYKLLERDAYIGYIDTAFELMPALDGFVRATYTRTNRKSSLMNDSNGYDLRGGLRGQISPYLDGEIGVGYAIMDFDAKKNSNTSDYNNMVLSASVTNRISELTTQQASFSISPEQGYDPDTNYYKQYLAAYTITHRLNRMMNLNGLFEYLNIMESGGTHFKEKADIFRYGGGLSCAIAKNLSLVADYAYSHKKSNRHGKGYSQHIVTTGVRYDF
jgi:opacity protein-like surface antigen